MDEQLLQTKLYMPQRRVGRLRPFLVTRPRLIEKLSQGLNRKLALLCAPAGFGKTTLIADWLSQLTIDNYGWLSLDETDNILPKFLTYLVAALQTVDANLGQTLLAMLQAPQLPPIQALMGSLLHDINMRSAAADGKLLLVLDDYHLISEQTIHAALSFLLEHQPSQLHLVLLTREDPPIALARLRSLGTVNDIRLADLRFTETETAVFLNDNMGLNLTTSDIAALNARTEGWIAGLQMAGLSMQGRTDKRIFIQSFTGSNRYILDYLIEEVFQQQPPEIQDFLLKTAFLDRLCGPLCDSVLAANRESLALHSPGQQTLEQLEAANLFILPLDESRQWYRYHHLFADLLRHRLQNSGIDTAVIHHRAGKWYQSNKHFTDAIPHFLAAHVWEKAVEAILQVSNGMLRRGEAIILRRWIQQIPQEIIYDHPQFCLEYAWTLILCGELDAAEPYLQTAEDAAQKHPPFLGAVLAVQAFVARTRFNIPQAIILSQRALALLPAENTTMRSILTINLGIIYWRIGNLTDAEQVLTETRYAAAQSRNHYARLMAVGFLGFILGGQGRLQQAGDLIRAELAQGGQHPTSALAHRALAGLLYEWNDLVGAEHHLQLAAKLSEQIGNVEVLAGVYRLSAQLKLRQEDAAAAQATLAQMHQLDEEHDLSPFIRACNAAAHVLLAWEWGDLATAEYWTNQMSEPVDASPFFPNLDLTPIRLLLAQGNKTAAAQKLAGLYKQAAHAGWRWGYIEVRALQALAAATQADALTFLEDALIEAEPEGLIRTFVDKGTPLANLLRQLQIKNKQLSAYISLLLAAFVKQKLYQPTMSKAQTLVEPLSERELEILQLLGRRNTNAEIALALLVSVNTVKTHLQHIYEKLDVHDRRTAVARAQELSLIVE